MSFVSGLICGFDPNFERFAVIAGDNRLKIWDVASASLRQSFSEPGHLNTQFSTLCWGVAPASEAKGGKKTASKRVEGAVLALGTVKGYIVLLRGSGTDDSQDKRVLGSKGEGHSSRVNSLAFNKTGTFLFSCSNDTHVIQWNVETGQIVTKFQADKQPIRRFALSQDGSMLVTASTALKAWDLSSHKVIKKFTGHAKPVSGIILSGDQQYILSTAGDRFLSLWACKDENSDSSEENSKTTADAIRVFSCPNNVKSFSFQDHSGSSSSSSQQSKTISFLAVLDSGEVGLWKVADPASSSATAANAATGKTPKKKAKQTNPKTQTADGFIKLSLPSSSDMDSTSTSTSSSSSSSSTAASTTTDAITPFVPPSEHKKNKTPKARPPPRSLTAKILSAQFIGPDEIMVAHGTATKPLFERVRYIDKETGQIQSEITVITAEDSSSGSLLVPPTTTQPKHMKATNSHEVSVLGATDMQLPSPALFDEKMDIQKQSSGAPQKNEPAPRPKKGPVNEKGKKEVVDGELTLQEKLEMLELTNGNEEDGDLKTARQIRALAALNQNPPIASGEVPKAESLQAVLVQALHTNDKTLLESVLSVADETVIMNTVQRLPTSFVLPFLISVVARFRAKPNRGVVLMQWVRAVLIQHASFLMTLPDLAATLAALYQTIDTRISAFKRFLKLSGRLDLLLSQIEEKERSVSLSRMRPAKVYNEDDDEDEEEMDMAGEDDDDVDVDEDDDDDYDEEAEEEEEAEENEEDEEKEKELSEAAEEDEEDD